jgi:hypothetical protein
MKRKKKENIWYIQSHSLLYGRSSRAIRIVNGEIVGRAEKKKRSSMRNGGIVKSVLKVQKPPKVQKVPKTYIMDEAVQKKLDNLADPLALISRFERAQKYEAANSAEKYEYGLSDW